MIYYNIGPLWVWNNEDQKRMKGWWKKRMILMMMMMMENWGWSECWSKSDTAMALRLRPKVSSVGSPFLQLGSSATAFAFSQACSVPNLGFQPVRLQRKKYLSPTTFFVRASRTESKGVTLGFRAPQFEVFNFPSLHIFFFVFFETWNGVIIICFIYLFLDGLKLY